MENRLLKTVVLMAMLCLFGCASGPKVNARYFWPPPPDEPKLEYLGAYHGLADLTEKTFLTAIAGVEEETGLGYPMGIAADGSGKVYVTDLAERIVEFDLTAKSVRSFGGTAADTITKPSGIAIDRDGNVYVGDLDRGRILVFGKDGQSLSTLDLAGQAKSIGLIAIDQERKRIVVPDPGGNQLLIADLTGKIIRTIKTWGKDKDLDGLNTPGGATFDRQGNILVADTMNARVVRFTPEGDYVSQFGRRGDSIGDFGIIKGISVDGEGHIYVTDSKAHKLYVFNDKGDLLLVLGSLADPSSGLIGIFALPLGISIDRNDTIYIADRMNRRFQVYQYLNSAYLAKNPITKESVIAKPLEDKKEGGKSGAAPAKK